MLVGVLLVGLIIVITWLFIVQERLGELGEKLASLEKILRSDSELKDTTEGRETGVMERRREGKEAFMKLSSKENVKIEKSLILADPEKGFDESKLWAWFVRDWPLKVGALLVLFGTMYFLSYAIMNQWISPVWRVIGAFVIGVAGIVWGGMKLPKFKVNGSVIVGLGLAVALLSLAAGRYFYDLLSPFIAVLIMGLLVGRVGWKSIQNDYEPLSLVAAVSGSLVPILVFSGISDPTQFMVYFFVFSLLTSVVVIVKGWDLLYGVLIALYFGLIILLYSWRSSTFQQIDLFVGFGIAALYAAVNFITVEMRNTITLHSFVGSLVNAALIFMWVLLIYPTPNSEIYLYICWLLCFMMALYFYQRDNLSLAIVQYGAFGLAFLSVALSMTLDGVALAYAYLVISGVLIAGTMFVTKSTKYNGYVSWTFIVPLMYGIYEMSFGTTSSLQVNLMGLSGTFAVVIGVVSALRQSVIKEKESVFSVRETLLLLFVLVFLFFTTGEQYFGMGITLVSLGGYLVAGMKKNTVLAVIALGCLIFALAYVIIQSDIVFHKDIGLFTVGLALFVVLSTHYLWSGDDTSRRKYFVGWMGVVIQLLSLVTILWLFHNSPLAIQSMAGLGVMTIVFITLSQLRKNLYRPALVVGMYRCAHAIPYVLGSSEWQSGVLHLSALSLAGILCFLYALYVYISTFEKKVATSSDEDKKLAETVTTVILWAGCIYLFVSIWLVSHGLLENDIANISSLILYALIGIWQYMRGRNENSTVSTYLGGLIIAGVTARILLVEMHGLEIIRRVVVLIVIGLIFISSGFLVGKKEE